MKNRVFQFPWHALLFSLYPTLALLATNISEVDLQVALRPLLVSLLAACVVLVLLQLLVRNWTKAGMLTTGSLLIFFSYGHVYQALRRINFLGFSIGRHRYLLPLFIGVLLILILLVWRSRREFQATTGVLNAIAVILVLLPVFQTGMFLARTGSGLRKAAGNDEELILHPSPDAPLPDVYYIILDTYTRADALQRDYAYDNSGFVQALEERGFYVAECSRCNYSYTQGSLTTELNLHYLPELEEQLSEMGLQDQDIWVLLKQSFVRKQLEALGYTTIAFETGYDWSRIKDADIYLSLTADPLSLQRLTPFESMLVESTAALLWSDMQSVLAAREAQVIHKTTGIEGFAYSGYAQRQLFILDSLPELAKIPEPTFAFVHLLIPHVPYVFTSEGEIWSDPGYYSGPRAEPVDDQHWRDGYTSEITFINTQMLDIFDQILAQSKTPPIILVHGDHGLRGENRALTLSAFYLPGGGEAGLYPQITPVNHFRVIFDTYYGTDFGLLPDVTHVEGHPEPVEEINPACQLP